MPLIQPHERDKGGLESTTLLAKTIAGQVVLPKAFGGIAANLESSNIWEYKKNMGICDTFPNHNWKKLP